MLQFAAFQPVFRRFADHSCRRRVAVDEKQIEVDGDEKWLYAAINTESKLLLELDVFSRRGISPAAALLHRLNEKHDIDDTEFLVDAGGYLTALARRG